MTVFRIAAAAMVFFGAQNNIEVAWSLADITMGIEAIINIVVIIMLSGIVISALRDYEKQKAEGRDPVFHEKSIGLDNTDVWK
jgi:AGCS family alanine or glycine:cation symporter